MTTLTTCMMTSPPFRCTLPVGHDGPHATREGYGWYDSDDMDSGVTATPTEQEADESPSVDYEAMWWEAERRAEKAEAERDRWHSMWRQRRIKHLAPADITLHSANSADWVRVRVEHPALGVIEEGIPLPSRSVPNVVTDAQVRKALEHYYGEHPGETEWHDDIVVKMRLALTAALGLETE